MSLLKSLGLGNRHPDESEPDPASAPAIVPEVVIQLHEEFRGRVRSVAPEGWHSVWVQVELDDRQVRCNGFAAVAGSAQLARLTVPADAGDLLLAIRAATVAAGLRPWTTHTLVLRADGDVRAEYGFDPVPAEGETDRRLAWERAYLPGRAPV